MDNLKATILVGNDRKIYEVNRTHLRDVQVGDSVYLDQSSEFLVEKKWFNLEANGDLTPAAWLKIVKQ